MAFSAAELQSLGDVLKRYSFEIPEYQRGYAWQESQWQALWQDLENAHRSSMRQHFAGMMLLRPIDSERNRDEVEVVDGQQRLITTIMLANILCAHLKIQAPNNYSLIFRNNDDLQFFFRFYALGDAALGARLIPETASSYALNIKAAAEYFRNCVQTLSHEDAHGRLDTLLSRFRVFVLEVSPEFDIHIAFETLNNRGRRLSQMELLKNRLIYLTTVLTPQSDDDASAVRADIHAAWKGIYRWLGRSPKTQSHDDEFLLAHSTAYFGKKREAGWLEKKLLETEFTTANRELTFGSIRDYVSNLEFAAAWWSHIHVPDQLPTEHQRPLNQLERAGFAFFKPLLLAGYMRVTHGHAEAVSNPLKHDYLLIPVVALLEQVERFVVIIFRLLNHKQDKGKADMDGCAYALIEAGRLGTLEGEGLATKSDSEAVLLVADFIKAFIENAENDDGTYSDNRFSWTGLFDCELLTKVIEGRFRDGNGFYKWDFTRLVLVEYEEHFRRDGNNPIKLGWDDFSFDETVEHIYPQASEGKAEEYWNKQIKIDGRSDKFGKFKLSLKNSIGNLLFLSRADNSSVSNGPYTASKGNPCKRLRFRNGSYSSTEVATVFEDWNVISISARGLAILKFAEKRWDILLTQQPDDYTTYLPLLFGSDANKIQQVVKSGKQITDRNLRKLVEQLSVQD